MSIFLCQGFITSSFYCAPWKVLNMLILLAPDLSDDPNMNGEDRQ
jgi:hypothetical protein